MPIGRTVTDRARGAPIRDCIHCAVSGATVLSTGETRRDLAFAGTRLVRRGMVRRTVVRPVVPVRRPMRRTHDDDRRANDMRALEIAGADPSADTATMDSAPARLTAGHVHPEAGRQCSDLG